MAQSNNSNRLVVPGAQNAIDQMKYEIANTSIIVQKLPITFASPGILYCPLI